MNTLKISPKFASLANALILTVLSTVLFTAEAQSAAHQCQNLFISYRLPESVALIRSYERPMGQNKVMTALLSPRGDEVADPLAPVEINGRKVIGLTGQKYYEFDTVTSFLRGGVQRPTRVELLNENGKPYGLLPGSDVWDFAPVRMLDQFGRPMYFALAGAMAPARDGSAATFEQNPTRTRKVFDLNVSTKASGKLKLQATNPQQLFPYQLGTGEEWIVVRDGKVVHAHGYGGGPPQMEDDVYTNPNGDMPVYHEQIHRQAIDFISNSGAIVPRYPFDTRIYETVFNGKDFSSVKFSRAILSGLDENGFTRPSAKRKAGGLLVEGPHVYFFSGGKLIKKMSDIRRLRAEGKKISRLMLFSMGDYFGDYGAGVAWSDTETSVFKPQLSVQGDFHDPFKDLKKVFTWLGRPALVQDEAGQLFVLLHGVPLSEVPTHVPIGVPPTAEHFDFFMRRLIAVPVRLNNRSGGLSIEMLPDARLTRFIRQLERQPRVADPVGN